MGIEKLEISYGKFDFEKFEGSPSSQNLFSLNGFLIKPQ